MATNKVELQEAILKAVDAVVTQRNNELKLDKTITAIIKKNVGVRHGKPVYQVQYNGGTLDAVAQNSEDSYVPQTSVYVMIPEGDFSKEKIIIGRAASIQTDRSSSIVAAAVNKYSIVGSNLLESNSDKSLADLQFGLHSFHPSTLDSSHGIDHRAQFLYKADVDTNLIKFNNNKLNIYKEETTAVMIKADFLTNLDLDQRQQPGARYGLIFTFAFDNLNKGYGETNREILENIGQIVFGQYERFSYLDNEIISSQNTTAYLIDLVQDFENSLQQNYDLNYYIRSNTGKIDQTIEYITSMYNSFQATNAKLDKEIINNTVNAYLVLLEDLKKRPTLTNIITEYQKWLEEVVGEEAQKYEQFVLTSDDMIGNPMAFSKWNTQYCVFKINLDTFNHLDSILFYKEGFLENAKSEAVWPRSNPGGPDIFVKNLQFYAMNPLDEQSGDYQLKVEPSNGYDVILSSNYPSTQFKSTVLRKMYEDLTRNGKMSFLWFKEDSRIINSQSNGYHYLGGAGWQKITHTGTNYLFSTSIEDNRAYKNNYKCVAIYEPSVDDKVILSCEFSVYNRDAAIDLKLESDMGTVFTYDAGAPTIKVLVNEDRINGDIFKEVGFSPDAENEERLYKYDWAIKDAANGYTLFLDEMLQEIKLENMDSAENAILVSAKASLLSKIQTYVGYKKNLTDEELTVEEVSEGYKATRIKYPVSIGSSGFTVYCYLKKYDSGNYYDVGSAGLEFILGESGVIDDYQIQIENGNQIFQYDEYGNTPLSDSKKDPLSIYPLRAKLLTPSGVEVDGANFVAEWIFPIEDSMLTTTETLVLNPLTDLVQKHVGQEFSFSIADLYNPDAYDNQITCHVFFDGKDYYKDTSFFFGKQGNNGTNGTDVVAKIDPVGLDPSNILITQPLILYVQKNNNSEATAQWNIGGNRQSSEDFNLISDNLGLKLNVYQKGSLIGEDSYDDGYPHWNLAGNPSETSQTMGKFFSIEENGKQLQWTYDNNNDELHYLLQNIRAEVSLNHKEQTYYAFFSLPIIEYEDLGGLSVFNMLNMNRIGIDKKTYLKEIIYNQDGRNPIYSHNQGLKLINIPNNIDHIVFNAKGGWDCYKSAYSNQVLEVLEQTPNFGLSLEKDVNNSSVSSEIVISNVSSEVMVYVIPNDTFNGSATNNRIEASLYDINNRIVATVYAPIYMALNTFGLTSLNAWDGNTVKIDEDNGYIMAPQIGAGEKDSNNRFTGVLMGKTETYTGGASNEEEVGLFGYSHGLQSIFLDSNTGDATFGLPDGYTFDTTSGTPVPTTQGDEYGEGRIELRPGDVSKVGGWRLGRRSIYYTMTPDSTQNTFRVRTIEDDQGNIRYIRSLASFGYKYSGEIGPAYDGDISTPGNKNYAAHHEKDIKTNDSGLLLSANPSYISIKGKKLGYEDIDNGLNSNLSLGDSLEIQLDPQTPTLFTIFRHNGENRPNPGKRFYLAGINDKGELIANGTARDDGSGTGTKSGTMILKAFKDTIDSEASYAGTIFEVGSSAASTRTFFQIFREKPGESVDDYHTQVYLTGGQVATSGELLDNTTENGDEYLRPISIHGRNLALYARTGNPSEEVIDKNGNSIEAGYNWITTDANIKISTNNYQTQLGETLFALTRENENSLDTRGSLNINLGFLNKPIDEFDTETVPNAIWHPYNLTGLKSTRIFNRNGIKEVVELDNDQNEKVVDWLSDNYYTEKISSDDGIQITTDVDYIYKTTKDKFQIYTHYNSDEEKTNYNYFSMEDGLLELGRTGINAKETDVDAEKINKNYIQLNKDDGLWETGHNLTLKNANQLKIWAMNNGSGSQYNSTDAFAQILIQAGTRKTNQSATQLFLNSSNNTWTTTYKQEDGTTSPKTGSKTNSWFRVSTTRTGQGIFLYDTIDNNNAAYTYFGVDAHQLSLSGQFSMQQQADKLFFNSTNFAGTSGSITCNISNITNLKAAIDALANRIAQVADAFNKHYHNFSDSSSETVSWTAPTHNVLTSVNVTDSHQRIIGHANDSNVTLGTVSIAGGADWTITKTSSTHSDEPTGSGTGYVDKIGKVVATPSTGSVGGESFSKTVTLTVNEKCYVPENQKIKDSDF